MASKSIIRIQPGERVPIRLSQLQRHLILEHTFMSPELEEGIGTISLDLDDLDELLGAVAAEANHCKEP